MPKDGAVTEAAERYRVGDLVIDARGGAVTRDACSIPLPPLTFNLLLALVRRAPSVVRREELLEAVWPGEYVSDAALSQRVLLLRQALGESGGEPRYVGSSRGWGYRVVAPVERLERVDTPPRSLAVLPLVNLSSDEEDEYLADGLADEILTLLAAAPGLRLTARTSSFAFRGRDADVREIGAKLGVSAVLEGSLRRTGDRLRINVQLINAADGFHLWAERFDRPLEDLFAIECEIAQGIEEHLKVRPRACEPERAPRPHRPLREAHHLYLKGRYLLNRRGMSDMQRALESFEQATDLDADYAPAHIGIADIFSVLAMWGYARPDAAFARVKAAASRALEIDDSLAAGHVALGSALLLADWDREGARSHFDRAVAGPRVLGGAIGPWLFYMLLGRKSDALAWIHSAIDADPLSAIAHVQSAAILIGVGDHDVAEGLLETAMELDGSLPMGLFWLGYCRSVHGRLAEAVSLFERAAGRGLLVGYSHLAMALAQLGETDRARAAVTKLEQMAAGRYVSPFCLALAYAGIGEQGRALDALVQTIDDRSPMLTMALIGPGFRALYPGWLQDWLVRKRDDLWPTMSGETSSVPVTR